MYEFKNIIWNSALYIHILTAAVPLIVGPFLFINELRNKYLNTHRVVGKIYVICIFISGLIGIYLTLFAFGGILAKLGFFLLDLAWIYTTYKAYSYIRNKKLKLHEEWMIRSYAVTFAALTFRIWSAIIGCTFDNFTLGYVIAVWLCWTGNLLVVEVWLRKSRRMTANIQSPVNLR